MSRFISFYLMLFILEVFLRNLFSHILLLETTEQINLFSKVVIKMLLVGDEYFPFYTLWLCWTNLNRTWKYFLLRYGLSFSQSVNIWLNMFHWKSANLFPLVRVTKFWKLRNFYQLLHLRKIFEQFWSSEIEYKID